MLLQLLSINLTWNLGMKYVLGTGIFVIGCAAGYLAVVKFPSLAGIEGDPITEVVTQTITDTIVKTQKIKVPETNLDLDSTDYLIDTLDNATDSIVNFEFLDSLDEDLSIRREVLESSKWLTVKVLEEFEDKDSLIEEMMGIKDEMPSKIQVEFWNSPLNFSGYKLSRTKLVIYGMIAQLDYTLYRRKATYYLGVENVFYALVETDDFKSYKEVSKSQVFK